MMKNIFLSLLILSFASVGFAQDAAEVSTTSAKLPSYSAWSIGLSLLQWNETLKLQQGAKYGYDTANYNGVSLNAQQEYMHTNWGWSWGGFVGTGRANAGGNVTTITYAKDKQSFVIFGVSPRAFYRLSEKINLGVSALAYIRSVDWPGDGSTGVSTTPAQNFTATALLDMNVALGKGFNFYQGIGPTAGGTMWMMGLNYSVR